MALHGKTQRTPKQRRTHYAAPSRDARLGRRWKARVEQMTRYLRDRDEAWEMNAARADSPLHRMTDALLRDAAYAAGEAA